MHLNMFPMCVVSRVLSCRGLAAVLAVVALAVSPPVFASSWEVEADPMEERPPAKEGELPELPTSRLQTLLPASPAPVIMISGGIGEEQTAVYDLIAGRPVARHPKRIDLDGFALAPDGKTMAKFEPAAGEAPAALKVFDTRNGRERAALELASPKAPAWIAFVGPHEVAVAQRVEGTPDHQITLFDTRRKSIVWTAPGERVGQLAEQAYATTPNGRYLAVATVAEQRNVVRLFDAETGEIAGEFPIAAMPSGGSVTGLAVSRSGQRLAVLQESSLGVQLMVWNLAENKVADIHDIDMKLRPSTTARDAKTRVEFMGDEHVVLWTSLLLHTPTAEAVHQWPDTRDEAVPVRVVDGGHVLVRRGERWGVEAATPTGLNEKRLAAAEAAEAAEAAAAEAERLRQAAVALPEVPSVSAASAKTIELATASGDWPEGEVSATPAQPLQKPITGTLPGSYAIVVTSVDGQHLLIGSTHGKEFEPLHLLRATPAGGPGTPVQLPADAATTRPLAISPDGSQAVTTTTVPVGEQAYPTTQRLDVWDLETAQHVAGWQLTPTRPNSTESVIDAVLLDANHLLIRTGRAVSVWDIAKRQPVWIAERASVAVPLGGEAVLLGSQHGLTLIDPATGESRGGVDLGLRVQAIVIDPQRPVAAVFGYDSSSGGSRQLSMVDLTTGRVTHTVRLQERLSIQELQFVADEFLLAGNHLLDISQGIVRWSYTGLLQLQQQDRGVWHATQPRELVLRSFELPEPWALDAIRQAADVEPLLGPGMQVALAVDTSEDRLAQLVTRLEAAGLRVSDDAPIRLVGTQSINVIETAEYRHLDGSRRTETAQIKELVRRLAWERAGETLWEVNTTRATHLSSLETPKDGQSLQSKVDDQIAQHQQSNWLLSAVPAVIWGPLERTSLGTTRLTDRGPQAGE